MSCMYTTGKAAIESSEVAKYWEANAETWTRARMHAVDIAPTFIRHAQATEQAEPLGIAFRTGDALSLPFEADTFDFVTAFMSLMDMPDQGVVLQEARRVLRPSVGSCSSRSCIPASCLRTGKVLRDEKGQRRAAEVAGYFDQTDGRVDTWWFEALPDEERQKGEPFRTPRFHRTMSQWVEMITEARLAIERFVEPCASVELADSPSLW